MRPSPKEVPEETVMSLVKERVFATTTVYGMYSKGADK